MAVKITGIRKFVRDIIGDLDKRKLRFQFCNILIIKVYHENSYKIHLYEKGLRDNVASTSQLINNFCKVRFC